jgi:hypothetical protein
MPTKLIFKVNYIKIDQSDIVIDTKSSHGKSAISRKNIHQILNKFVDGDIDNSIREEEYGIGSPSRFDANLDNVSKTDDLKIDMKFQKKKIKSNFKDMYDSPPKKLRFNES